MATRKSARGEGEGAQLERVKQMLTDLRIPAASSRLEQLLAESPKMSRLEWLLALLEPESNRRYEQRVERRIKRSKLPERKTFDGFDFDFQPSLSRDLVMDLATLAFVPSAHNVLIAGKSGTGKSHIAKALGLLACMANIDVRYTTCGAMLSHLNSTLVDNTLHKALKQYTLPRLLLIDEVGLEKVESPIAARAGLMQKVILPRYERRSTIITSNIDWDLWGAYLEDALGATAIIDRLIHHSHVIVINGPSYRNAEHEREVDQDGQRLDRSAE